MIEYDLSEDIQNTHGWASTAAGRLVASAVIALEATPANEAVRIAAALYAGTHGMDPLGVAAVYGATTMAIEAPAAYATAAVLDTPAAKGILDKVNNRLDKMGISEVLKTNTLTEAGIGMFGGSAIAMVAKHRQDTERTFAANTQYGLKMSAGIAAMCTAQGYAVAAGIEHPSSTTIGVAAIGIGATVGAFKWAKSRWKDNHQNKEDL